MNNLSRRFFACLAAALLSVAAQAAVVVDGGPSNDNFARRVALYGGNTVGSTNAIAATRETGEPNILGQSGSRSVWYQWTAPVDGLATFAVRATREDVFPKNDYAPLVGVYTGPAAFEQFTVVVEGLAGGNANSLVLTALGGGSASTYTAVEFNATAGTVYYIAVETWYNATLSTYSGYLQPHGFNAAGYFGRNPDVAAAFTDADRDNQAWLHYWHFGMAEGRTFDSNFLPDEYLELYPELATALGTTSKFAALMHWLTYGHPVEDRMGRVPSGFDVDAYLARYPDLAAAFGDITPKAKRNVTAWWHYIDYGVAEGRSDGEFDAMQYLASYSDLSSYFGSDVGAAALHWYVYGRREGRRIPAGFNVQNYRAWNGDVAVILSDDLYAYWLHYRDHGVNEGRVFDDLFRVDEYLALNADVAAVVGTDRKAALLHWLNYGQYEGRSGRY